MRFRTVPKYLRCFRHSFAENFDFEVAKSGMEGNRLFASRVCEFNRAEKKEEIKITIARFVCQLQMAVAAERKRVINRFVGSEYPLNKYLYTPSRPSSLLSPSALPVMLRANQRPPSILGDDPFSHALRPSVYESDYEKHSRLEREIEAKRISDRIDDEIRKDKERLKRAKQDVKVSTQPHKYARGDLSNGLGKIPA